MGQYQPPQKNFSRVLLVLLFTFSIATGLQFPDISWDPYDPMYNETQCGHQSKVFKVRQGDMVNIICRNRDLNNAIVTQPKNNKNLYYNIHVTDNFELYANRRTRDQNGSEASTIHRCQENLYKDSIKIKTTVEKYKVIFSRWGSTKGRIFEVGKTYYFFTTSNGTKASLQNTIAPNATRHMGFEVYVCRANETCENRVRIHRCIIENNKTPKPEVINYEAPSDGGSSTLQWSTTAISIVIAIVFIAGFVFGILLDRYCQMKKRERNQDVKAQSAEVVDEKTLLKVCKSTGNEKTLVRGQSCTGTEKTDVSDGSTNGDFEQLHMAHV